MHHSSDEMTMYWITSEYTENEPLIISRFKILKNSIVIEDDSSVSTQRGIQIYMNIEGQVFLKNLKGIVHVNRENIKILKVHIKLSRTNYFK